jgi:hypothetical protein
LASATRRLYRASRPSYTCFMDTAQKITGEDRRCARAAGKSRKPERDGLSAVYAGACAAASGDPAADRENR